MTVSESVEVPCDVESAMARWRRDETIPQVMRAGNPPSNGGPKTIAWEGDTDAPGRQGRVMFEPSGERTARITITLEPEPEDQGGRNAEPRARGLLDRFRDSFPAQMLRADTPLGGMSSTAGTEPGTPNPAAAPQPAEERTPVVDPTERRHMGDTPHNR
jgi:hypothetical protein